MELGLILNLKLSIEPGLILIVHACGTGSYFEFKAVYGTGTNFEFKAVYRTGLDFDCTGGE